MVAPAGGLLAARRRPLAVGVSLAAHAVMLLALWAAQPSAPTPQDPPPMTVSLVDVPRPPPPPARPKPPAPARAPRSSPKATPTPAHRPAARPLARRVAPSREVAPAPLAAGRGEEAAVQVSDAELAGAARAGSGGGSGQGGGCDMAGRVQEALRRDRLASAAIAQAHSGPAIVMWNGGWVRHPGQEGGGLAAVREAILWEVGFSPAACRSEPMRGLVLLSMNDGPGAPRLVVGRGAWRWSDLLR